MKTNVPRRQLGALQVSTIGLGCMGMSDFYGPADEAVNLSVLQHALDIGVDFWDTADMYGVGANEELLAKVLKTRRADVVLATKFGNVRGKQGEMLGVNGRPDYVRSACDASLRRLGVDHIDLYYQHRVDPTVPIEDTVGAMGELVRAGKVRYLGLSEASAQTIERAAAVHQITALQSEYSLWTRDVADEVLPVCRKHGIGFVAYSPLGRGFLTGAIQRISDLDANDWRRQNPRFSGDNFDVNKRLVEAVTRIAQACGATAAQLALAWLLEQGKDIVPIPGTRKIERLDENAQAATLRLSEAELSEIDRTLTAIPIAGTRYPAGGMTSVNR